MPIIIGSASELEIKPHKVMEFYDKNWNRRIALSDEEFYKWQFVSPPKNGGVDNCCVAVSGKSLVGVMGLNERTFYLNGCSIFGAELTTWVVSPESRNSGIGPKMIKFLQNKYEVMTGMGISSAALPVYIRSGFRYLKSIPRYIKIIDWESTDLHAESTPLSKKYGREFRDINDFTVVEYNNSLNDDIFDKLKENKNSFSRYATDNEWRYINHPYFKYELKVIENNGKYCVVAYRIDRDIDGLVMMHCLDIYGDKEAYLSAVGFLAKIGADENVSAIDFYATNADLCAAFRYAGWFSTLDDDFLKFPHLFHPIEIRSPATTSLILWSRDNMIDLLNIGNLHITKQDADFDRPTMKTLGR